MSKAKIQLITLPPHDENKYNNGLPCDPCYYIRQGKKIDSSGRKVDASRSCILKDENKKRQCVINSEERKVWQKVLS